MVPERTAEAGEGFTDTDALAPAAPAQVVASVTPVIVYVVVTIGVTETVWPDEIPVKLKVVVPSVYVTAKGAVPVRLNVSVELALEQSVAGVADTEASGSGLTVTNAEPVPVTVQPAASVTVLLSV